MSFIDDNAGGHGHLAAKHLLCACVIARRMASSLLTLVNFSVGPTADTEAFWKALCGVVKVRLLPLLTDDILLLLAWLDPEYKDFFF